MPKGYKMDFQEPPLETSGTLIFSQVPHEYQQLLEAAYNFPAHVLHCPTEVPTVNRLNAGVSSECASKRIYDGLKRPTTNSSYRPQLQTAGTKQISSYFAAVP